MPEPLEEAVMTAHKMLGLFGHAYVVCMSLLYVTGTYFSLTVPNVLHYKSLRTLLFNFLGILLVMLGYRAIRTSREARVLQRGRALPLHTRAGASDPAPAPGFRWG